MNTEKEKVALLTGGYTGEREISVKSARNVAQKLDPKRFDVYIIYIVPEGWHYLDAAGDSYEINKHDFSLQLVAGKINFDVAFICIHGAPGENGSIQGYLELVGLPYTSCRQQTAAITMNKAFTKAAVAHIPGLHVAKSSVITGRKNALTALHSSELQYPLFIKPNTGGSSIGMAKVAREEELPTALERAFAADHSGQIIVEEYIEGTEYSIGAYRSHDGIQVLPPSEVKIEADYFDFETKYHAESPIDITPGRIKEEDLKQLRTLVASVFELLDCRGVVRLDFIQQRDSGKFYFLEINTIPGQTDSSFIPKQLRCAGIELSDFFSKLIDEAYDKPRNIEPLTHTLQHP